MVRMLTTEADLSPEQREALKKSRDLQALKDKHAGKLGADLTQADLLEWLRMKVGQELELD